MIGLAWALSSSWLLPVLGWPYFNWQGATPQAAAYSKVGIQYNTVQYSTIQYNIVQYCTKYIGLKLFHFPVKSCRLRWPVLIRERADIPGILGPKFEFPWNVSLPWNVTSSLPQLQPLSKYSGMFHFRMTSARQSLQEGDNLYQWLLAGFLVLSDLLKLILIQTHKLSAPSRERPV